MPEILKVLGDDNRLRIMNILMRHELCVCEIEVILEMTQSNVSRHLGKLKRVGIIESTKDAQWIHYKVDEVFNRENIKLIDYLKEKIFSSNPFKSDWYRLDNYRNSALNCQFIAEDKEHVLSVLKGEHDE